jgi:hypothetical protein
LGQKTGEFPSETGTATIPASLLSQWVGAWLVFYSSRGVRLSAGDYKVDLFAHAPVYAPNKTDEFLVLL